MKTKYFFNVVMAVFIAVIFSVLTGCASTGAATADAVAEQLAADINAIQAGSAEVDGGTVTITGGVRLETVLTVPEGVTLDLTAEGAALELQDGAVLTVNGVVNARGHGDHGKGWVEGSLRIEYGATAVNGSGSINLKSKGRLLNIWGGDGKRQLTLDGVTLVGLPDNDQSLVEISEGGEFVLKSGKITGNTRASDEWVGGGGVAVYKGRFTMEGGEISGNRADGKDGSAGGGLYVGENATFIMEGGEISGNTANDGGGGVGVSENATFTMTGGTINGNTAKWGGGVSVDDENAEFTIKDGKINGNTATEHGGGVQVVENATFIMEGGEISGNTTKVNGGGVFVNYNGTFTMEGGEISGNTAAYGGGVRNRGSSTFTMKGGRIQGNTDSDGFTKNIAAGEGDAVLSAGSAKWGVGGTYTKGGMSQTGGSDIAAPIKDGQGSADDTLIATPGQ